MSTGFKYVYNSLHEQSFLSSVTQSCEGCTLVARQQWCLKLRFAAKGSRVVGWGGWNSPFGVEALGLTRDQSFTAAAACWGHCREATSSVAVTPPVSFQLALRPKFRVSKSKLSVCVCV